MILAIFSIFVSTFLANFGFPTSKIWFIFFYSMECMFAIDIVLCFFTQYINPEDNKPVRDIKNIALRYINSGFIFDALATFPFHIVLASKFRGTPKSVIRINCIFLLKLFRGRKLTSLMDDKVLDDFIISIFTERLKRVIKNDKVNKD